MPLKRLAITIRKTLLIAGLASLSAVPLRVSAQIDDHQYSTAAIQAGFKLYSRQCQLCHGTNGDGIAGVNLARQRFKRASSDDDIKNTISAGVATAGMPAFRFQPDELSSLVAFIRSGFDTSGTPFKLGNAARGKAIYEGKGGCQSCHQPKGEGRFNAPSLSEEGSTRQPAEIQRYLLEPSAAMLPINRPAVIVTRDGRTLRGRRVNEDTFSVQLRDQDQVLHSIAKTDIKTYELAKTSAMPSVAGKLAPDELADLIGYLVSLKGP
jgi:putative heme-binding domain-containing protein